MSTEYNLQEIAAGRTTEQHVAHVMRYWQGNHGLLADGKGGAKTRYSIEHDIRSNELYTPWDGPLTWQPANRTQVYELFGNPGAGKVDKTWKKASIITVRDLPGVPWRWYFKINRRVEPYLREGLSRARIAAPEYVIKRAGAFNFRHQRFDKSRPLSYHSWGIAVDFDASRNFSKKYFDGGCPDPWTPEWMEVWPDGIPKAFVDAMASCGWSWGGYWSRWPDPMHFQWTGNFEV